MGALLHVNMHYGELAAMIASLNADPAYPVLGTFMEGTPVYSIPPGTRGLLVFGNEARGISSGLLPLITSRITIPVSRPDRPHVESLNVASAVAISCALFVHK
jgi:TrmH family RNA methyltransferase